MMIYSVVEPTENGYRKVADLSPPPGQRELRCDDCRHTFDQTDTIYRLQTRDSTGLYPTGEKYVCRDCNGNKSGAV